MVVTVKDAVRFLCHVAGGVHHGMPKNAHEEKIDEFCRTYQIQELPSVHASIFAVARIVVRGLEPLEAQIRQEAPGPRDLR
ncbi:MAG: hypothetical protein H0T61_13360 [Actinobacteria bacterium]|nr:hypothetical protein [Actinomycetota bacterium]